MTTRVIGTDVRLVLCIGAALLVACTPASPQRALTHAVQRKIPAVTPPTGSASAREATRAAPKYSGESGPFSHEPAHGTVRVELTHEMTYQYERPVRLGTQFVRLHPLQEDSVPTAGYSLKIEPEGHSVRWAGDEFGNVLAVIDVPDRVTEFKITVRFQADVSDTPRTLPVNSEPLGALPFVYEDVELRTTLTPYLGVDQTTRELEPLIAAAAKKARSVLDFGLALQGTIASRVRYNERLEPGVQTPSETLRRKSGACRDSAWLLVQTLRQAGFAARYVSGYLIELAGPGAEPGENRLSFHAWADFYLPGAGWVALDATSSLPVSQAYIPLAAAPTATQVAPVDGLVEQGNAHLSFDMAVRRVDAESTVR